MRFAALASAAALLLAPPAAGQAPVPAAACAAERSALEAERAELGARIGDVAMGRKRAKRKVGGGEVAAGVAGAAASLLLPFGVGALLGAGAKAAAASGRGKRPKPPAPDVPAMLERESAIDSRLAELAGCGGE